MGRNLIDEVFVYTSTGVGGARACCKDRKQLHGSLDLFRLEVGVYCF